VEIYSSVVKDEILAEYRIFTVRKLPTIDFEKELEWICRSFGFVESRDKKRQLSGSSEPSLKLQKPMKGYRAMNWPRNSL